ncbi:MAG: protein kinase, partial [Dehalococcoidia bacterium]
MTAPRPTSDPALAAGAVLGGRYRLEALVARGGASEVYRATDVTLGRDVAVKVVALDAAAALEREASMLALTGAPQVPACYDRGIEDRVAYLVMEYVPGPNLAQALDAGPALPEVARRWAAAATRVVEAVQARGVVHGDLKPSHF